MFLQSPADTTDRLRNHCVRGYDIFYNPSDYPGWYVVREWRALENTVVSDERARLFGTIEQARASIPKELALVRKAPKPGKDVPSLVESWGEWWEPGVVTGPK